MIRYINLFVIIFFSVFLFSFSLPAKSQSNTQCTYSAGCNKDQASKACKAFVSDNKGQYPYLVENCSDNFWDARFRAHLCQSSDNCSANAYGVFYYSSGCPSGKIWNESKGACVPDCSQGKDKKLDYSPVQGALYCDIGIADSVGCEFVLLSDGDGTGTQSPTYQQCDYSAFNPNCGSGYYPQPVGMSFYCYPIKPPECPKGQMLINGKCVPRKNCPSGQHEGVGGACEPDNNQCPPGKIKGPDGSCIDSDCPNGQVRGSDGTCKKNNDPNKDNGDDDKYFSGGDDCAAPPSCSGDPILCGQSRIQWRIDCNTRKNVNIAGGACSSMPVCTGEKCNAMEYSQLIMQWRTACALEKKGDSASGDDGNGDKQPNWTKVGGMSQDPGQGSNTDDTKIVSTNTIGPDKVDSSGWLGSGGCPSIMGGGGVGNGVAARFADALASPPSYFCDFIGAISAITVLGAAVWCAVALAKG